jgi:hypothetical protein
MDPLTQSGNFENLLESNQTLLPKENLFLMTCYTSVQLYKNYGGQKVFVSSIQIEQSNSLPDLRIFFLQFSLILSPL